MEYIITDDRCQLFPMSYIQKRLWIIAQTEEEKKSAYNVVLASRINGNLSVLVLEKSINAIVERHETLRTSFRMKGEEPVQVVVNQATVRLQSINLSAKNAEDKQVLMNEYISREAEHVFQLSLPPLFRVLLLKMEEAQHILVFNIHHLVADADSVNILLQDIFSVYRQYLVGENMVLPELPIQYGDYAAWEYDWMESPAAESQIQFWKEKLEEVPPFLEFPFPKERPPKPAFEAGTFSARLTDDFFKRVVAFAKEEKISLFMLLEGVFSLLLYKYSGKKDFTIGVPVSTRVMPETERIIGFFINTLAIRHRIESEQSVRYFLGDNKAGILAALNNRLVPFERIVEALNPERSPYETPLFQVLFSHQKNENAAVQPTGLDVAFLDVPRKRAMFQLSFFAVESPEGLDIKWEYNQDVFTGAFVEKMHGHFVHLLYGVLKNPERSLGEIPLATLAEEEKITNLFNQPRPYPLRFISVSAWFGETARLYPDRPAIVSGNTTLTYWQVNEKANQLAHTLLGNAIGTGALVAVHVHRSPELIIALLAVLKAGAACVPIDPALPGPMKGYMLEQAGVSGILCDTASQEWIATHHLAIPGFNVQAPASFHPNDQDPELGAVSPDALLYVLYTSGSTGQPKGVMLTHGNLMNLLVFQQQDTILDLSCVLQFTTISFDVSFQEIFSALLSGGKLVMIDEETRNDVERLFGTIQKENVKTLFLPASFLRFVLNNEHYLDIFPQNVRHIVTAGEQLVIPEKFKTFLVTHQVYIHNHYGPAETHVVTTRTLSPFAEIPSVPDIGKPVPGTALYILDENGNCSPIGIPGEMYIGGVQVGRGYRNRKNLTKERFIPAKWGGEGYWYRTGDIGKWKEDGNIEYIGRVDNQLKVRGFRVEPGQVEFWLLKHPDITNAAVVVQHEPEKNLVGYFTAGTLLETAGLRKYLLGVLPEYMIPAWLVQVPRIPVNRNGKIDWRALPKPSLAQHDQVQSAGTALERAVEAIWGQVLNLPLPLGTNKSFFELGGHSLKAILMIHRVRKELELSIAYAAFVRNPTIKGMVDQLAVNSLLPILKAAQKAHYPATFAQQAIYAFQNLHPESTAYHITFMLEIVGSVADNELIRLLKQLVARHETLRTAFVFQDGVPVQQISDDLHLLTEVLEPDAPENLYRQFVRPFELQCAPLFRVGFSRSDQGNKLLLLDFHHLIMDGASIGVFIQELVALYKQNPLPPLPIQFKDFSEWMGKKDFARMKGEWDQKLPATMPNLHLPADFQRGDFKGAEGNTFSFALDREETLRLVALAEAESCSLFSVLLSMYCWTLHECSGEECLVVGTPMAGRMHPDLHPLIGMFVNMVPVVARLQPEKTFVELAGEISRYMTSIYELQDYPFDKMADERKITQVAPGSSLFKVVFGLHNYELNLGDLQSLESIRVQELDYANQTTKYDLTLNALQKNGLLEFSFEYDTHLFREQTIQQFVRSYRFIAERVIAQADIPLGALSNLLRNKNVSIMSSADFDF